MVEIHRILCPIDFSETSRHALEHATALAKWYDAKITALHVVYPAPLLPQPPVLFVDSTRLTIPTEAELRMLEERLRGWLDPLGAGGVRAEALFDQGRPAGRIIDQAEKIRADLIVMGTHGHTGFDRFVLGSVAEKVLRKARCPVLTVPPASTTAAKVPYARLLCAVDFSDSSLAALRFAFSLAEEADAHLTILHVLELPDERSLSGWFGMPEFRKAMEQDARCRLDRLVSTDVLEWCKPATTIATGKPYHKIVEIAREEADDLIVIGVRGRNAVDLTLFGSTTNQVVRRAPCPVLTLKQ